MIWSLATGVGYESCNMKTLIELRTAINVSGNTFLPLSHGDKRKQQYIDGIKVFSSYYEEYKHCDVVLVDNTLESEDEIPREIRDVLPEEAFLYVKLKNDYGKRNKGSGMIEMWREYSDILTTYDYLFYYEPRLMLEDFSFIKSFLNNPRNYFCLAREDQVKTGYFGAEVEDMYEFYTQVDLDKMVSNSINLENIMFSFFKEKNTEFIKNAYYCLWHDAAKDKYVRY